MNSSFGSTSHLADVGDTWRPGSEQGYGPEIEVFPIGALSAETVANLRDGTEEKKPRKTPSNDQCFPCQCELSGLR